LIPAISSGAAPAFGAKSVRFDSKAALTPRVNPFPMSIRTDGFERSSHSSVSRYSLKALSPSWLACKACSPAPSVPSLNLFF